MASLGDPTYRARIIRACIVWSPVGFALAFFLGWIQGVGLKISLLLGAILMAGCLIAALVIRIFGRHSWIAFIVIVVAVKLIAWNI